MDVVRQVAAVMAVFSLLGLALWALRRGGSALPFPLPAGRSRLLASVDRLALSPQHALHLVRLGDRELVVATHPQGCTVLTERKSQEPSS